MDAETRAALDRDRTIDITTTGRRSGQPRRIETWFYNVDGRIYLSGSPGRRDWYANLQADPRLVFHLKQNVRADLPCDLSEASAALSVECSAEDAPPWAMTDGVFLEQRPTGRREARSVAAAKPRGVFEHRRGRVARRDEVQAGTDLGDRAGRSERGQLGETVGHGPISRRD